MAGNMKKRSETMANEERNNSGPATGPVLWAVAIVVWGIHLIPLAFPTARLWGFNHLIYLSPVYLYIYIIGGLIGLGLMSPWAVRAGEGLYNIPARLIFEKPSKRVWFLVSIIALIIFWIERLPIFLLGDSYTVIENIGNDLPVIFKYTEMGTIYLAYGVSKLLPLTGRDLGIYTYALISTISGAVTVFFFCGIAYEWGRNAAERLMIFCLSIFAGWIVLFLGYTENYSILWTFMSALIYFATRYMRGTGPLWLPALLIVAAAAMHIQMLFFIIALPILFIARGKAARIYNSHRWLGYTLFIIGALAGITLFAYLYNTSLEFMLLITPVLHGRLPIPYYSMFSIPHLLDVLYQYLLLVPVLPLLIYLGWRKRMPVKDKIDLFLLMLSLGGFIFLFVIDPKLGMARDWDLFALVGLPPMLLMAKSAIERKTLDQSLFAGLTVLLIVLIMPFWATNLNRQSALNQYKHLLNIDIQRNRSGITVLRQIALAENDSLLADSLKDVLIATFPATHLAPMAHELADQGRYQEAMILVDSLALYEPYSVEYYNLRGLVNLRQGRYAEAIQYLELAAKLGRYDARPLASLAAAYNHLRQVDRMMDALRRGQKRDPKAPEIKIGLMAGFYAMQQFDSAMAYAQEVMQVRPTEPNAYWVAGHISYLMGDKVRAKIYLTRFIEMSPSDANRQKALDLLKQLE